jgi:hypothetical protein
MEPREAIEYRRALERTMNHDGPGTVAVDPREAPTTISPAQAKRLKLCVDTVNGYGHFHPGQDGHQGMKELTEFIYSLQPKPVVPPKPELKYFRVNAPRSIFHGKSFWFMPGDCGWWHGRTSDLAFHQNDLVELDSSGAPINA